MPEDKEKTLQIILDMFSGRPNPSWSLSEREVEELRRLLSEGYRELSRIRRRKPPGLGYRGFVITNDHQLEGFPLALRVFDGTITIREVGAAGPEDVFAIQDVHRIEYWLLEQAAARDLERIIVEQGGPRLPQSLD